jgi:endonuclease/exonuclease/phosphatase family metal-dependent hydrolase
MDDIPPRSYGPLIETTLRIITWNVWGLYDPWLEREAAIVETLRDARPDIVVLTESWAKGEDSQSARLAGPLGLPHHAFSGITAQEDKAALSGVAVMSRWPIRRESSLTFGSARVQFAELNGPRGPIQVYGLVMDAWWFDESQARQRAVRELAACVNEDQDKQVPLIICGDFNTDPDSDEIRMLTGPNRRIGYIFSANPRAGGAGHPLRAALLGTGPVNSTCPSDHYALQSDLRY